MTKIISHPDYYFVEKQRAAYGFELVVDSVALLLVGAVLTLFAGYVYLFWKRDRIITRAFVLLVVLLCSSEAIVEVWEAWCISITAFETSHNLEMYVALQVQSFFVPGVIALVQLFWLGTIYRSISQTSRIRWLLLIVSLLVVLAYALQVVLTAIIIHFNSPPPVSTLWKLNNYFNYTSLALILAIDLFVVLTLLQRLIAIRRRSLENLKSSVSLLGWIFLSFSILSTASMVATVLLDFYEFQEGKRGYPGKFAHLHNFLPVVSPIYALSMLSMLLARAKFWKQQGGSADEEVPEMRLVEDAPSSEEADETVPSTQVGTSIPELSMEDSNNRDSFGDGNEKVGRHTIHFGKDLRRQQDFGTLTEP